MKLRQIILLIVILATVGFIYYPIVSSQKEIQDTDTEEEQQNFVPVLSVKNENRHVELVSYGQILSNMQLDITMEVQGVIDRQNRTLKPGEHFKKGEIIIRLERTEALYNLLARRSSFVNLIASLLPDLTIDLSGEREKWENYLNELHPAKELPSLPRSNSRKEKLLINNRNIPSEFYNLKALEEQVEKYYYVAPFDGVIISSAVEPGSMATPGMRLATVAKTGDYEIKAPININQMKSFTSADTITIKDANNQYFGFAKLKRKAKVINEQTQSVDGYFKLYPKNNEDVIQGMYVNLSVKSPLFQKAVVLPENAVMNETVQLLSDSLIKTHKVSIIGSKTDSLFIEGIKDNSKVLLDQVKTPNTDLKYTGINRN